MRRAGGWALLKSAALWFLLVALGSPAAPAQQIKTVAGGGPNNVPATAANLDLPTAIAQDQLGNFYIAVAEDHRVYKVDSAGMLTVFAGSGAPVFGGDGGAATNAALNTPTGLAFDAAGNFFIVDSGNNRIRKVDNSPQHLITTVAGNGTPDFSGDGGAATSAALNSPSAVFVDGAGNLFISDAGNNRIRRVDTTGAIRTVAGNGTSGFSGDGGLATSAGMGFARGVFVDRTGNLFIADGFNNRIRKVDATTGTIQTVAGGGAPAVGLGDGGPATSAALSVATGVVLDGAGNILIADSLNNRIRKVDATTGTIHTVAGGGSPADGLGDDGPATSAALDSPQGIFVDGAGNILIADAGNSRIRKVDATGNIETVAGNGLPSFSGDGGPATIAGFGFARGASVDVAGNVFVDSAGNVFIADTNNNRIRKVDAATGNIETVAGNGVPSFSGDGGPATSASLKSPSGVFVDGAGNIFIADAFNDRIRRVDTTGNIETVAGNGNSGFSGDGGPAIGAALKVPRGVFVDSGRNIFIADTNNHRIRKVDAATGNIETVAGIGAADFSGDGAPATSAALSQPRGVFVDSAGNVFIADTLNERIRKVDATTGNIQTVAGIDGSGFSGDGGPAASAALNFPAGVAIDGAGNIFIADFFNNRIRKVDTTGTIETVAGGGTPADGLGDGGPATSAALNGPAGVSLDGAGNIFIADVNNDRIRKVVVPEAVLSAGSLTFAGQGVATAGTPRTLTLSNTGSGSLAIASIAISGANSGDFTQSNNCGASLAEGANCTINVAFKPTDAGPRAAAVAITTSAGVQSVSLSGTGTDFALALAAGGSNTATVSAGQTASYTLSLSASGAAQTVAVSCTGAPAGATCTVPATVTVTPGTTVPLNVSVSTTARSTVVGYKHSSAPDNPSLLWSLWATLALASLLFWTRIDKTRAGKQRAMGDMRPAGAWRLAVAMPILLLVLPPLALTGCGGGSGGGGGKKNPMPPSTSTLKVTATANGVSHTTQLTLTVQ
jgi:sugar lactone lactonase YvrE